MMTPERFAEIQQLSHGPVVEELIVELAGLRAWKDALPSVLPERSLDDLAADLYHLIRQRAGSMYITPFQECPEGVKQAWREGVQYLSQFFLVRKKEGVSV